MQHFVFFFVATLCLALVSNDKMTNAATTADLLQNAASPRNNAPATAADLLAVDSGAVASAPTEKQLVRKSRALFFPGFYKTYYPYSYGYGGYYPYVYPRYYGYYGNVASYYPYGYGVPGVIYG